MEERFSSRCGMRQIVLLVAIVLAGIFLRAWPSTGSDEVGYDERIYRVYIKMAQKEGIWNYPDVVRTYLKWQEKRSEAVVPPTRVGFLFPAIAFAGVTGFEPFVALHGVSLAASILLLLATAIIGYRLDGGERMLILTALMAVAPLQIYLAQRSLVDGYFAFWAVLCAWFLFESFRTPKKRGWLIAYSLSLSVLVLTKENAAFVFVALMATLMCLWALGMGRPRLELLVASFLAPALAVVVLASYMGGLGEWLAFYRMFSEKSVQNPYVIQFQDGAWYRYLIDFTLLSPCIVALVFGRIFQLTKEAKADIFWALFLGFSFFAMSCIRYGMSLRFAAYWDEPIRWLAASQLLVFQRRFSPRVGVVVAVVAVVLLATVDLIQYWQFFVKAGIYDPVSSHLLHVLKLVK